MRFTETMGTLDRRGFTDARGHRAAAPKRAPTSRAGRAAIKATRAADQACATFDRLNENLERLAAGLRTLADRRRTMLDAAAQPSPLVSASSGYVRDSGGNRVRPMTPADLNDINDRHYKRGRYANAV